MIAGCYVLDGIIKRDAEVRVVRDGAIVYTGRIVSLKRFKDDANEVRTGFECGVRRLELQRREGRRHFRVLLDAKLILAKRNGYGD